MLMCGYPVGVHFQVGGAERLKDLNPMVDSWAGGVERIEAEVDMVYI